MHDIRTYFFSSAPAAHSSRNTHWSDGFFGRERFRRFLLGDGVAAPRTTCLPLALEFRWRFLVKGVGERDGGDFDGELVHSSMPRVKRLSLHGGGETDKTEGDKAGSFYVRHFSDLNGNYVMVTMVTGHLTS